MSSVAVRQAKVSVALALVCAFGPAGAVEVNTATQAEIESVRGIGVAMSTAILAERARRPFADWVDFARRVRGAGSAGRRPAFAGLTVNGLPQPGTAVAADAVPGAAASAP